MTSDDWIYALLLLLSLLLGPFFNWLNRQHLIAPTLCTIVMSVTGFCMCLVVCRSHIWHSMVTTALACVILTLCSRKNVHTIMFISIFAYLTFFRTCHFMGIEKPSPHSNAVQLLLTLRLIGIAFELHSTWDVKNQLSKGDQVDGDLILRDQHHSVSLGIIDVWKYSYFYPGILTGPYYRYRTYSDFVNNFLTGNSRPVDNFVKLWNLRLEWSVALGLGYIVLSPYYYIDYARSDELLQDSSLLYKIYFMWIMFVTFRCRMFFAWVVSECVCMTLGLGGYPVASKPSSGAGPSDLSRADDVTDEHDYSTVRCVDMYLTELAPTVQDGMKGWNMTVQYWLAQFVYRRLAAWPQLRAYRVSLTMAVSAYWHGIHGGYYLSFLTIPLTRIAEDTLSKYCLLLPNQISYFVRWFYKFRVFDWTCMGFLLLSPYDTFQLWKSAYFYLLIVTIVVIVIDRVFRILKLQPRVPRDLGTHEVRQKTS